MLPTNLHICNIYLPNSQHLNEAEFIRIFRQLPKPFIITGDFNSHNILWGSHKTDTRGATEIAKWINETNVNLLNTNKPTHFTTTSAHISAIDLTLCNPRIAQNISWNVERSLFNSDHFPIKMTYHTSYCLTPTNILVEIWKSRLDNLPRVCSVFHLQLYWIKPDPTGLNKHRTRQFHTHTTEAVDLAIPKTKTTSSNSKSKLTPW